MGKIGKNTGEEVSAAKMVALEDGFVELPIPENRATHYPKGAILAVKPATVKQIKHWNMQDWENVQAVQTSMRLVDDMLKTNACIIVGNKKYDAKFICVNDKLWIMKCIRDVSFDSDTIQPLWWICQACDEKIDVEQMEESNWECKPFGYEVLPDMSIDLGTSIKCYVPTSVTNEMVFNYAMTQMRKPGAKEENVTKLLVEAEQASMLINPISWNMSGTSEADKANKKIIDDAKQKFEDLTLADFKKFKEVYDYYKKQDDIVGICPACKEKITIPSGQLDIRDLFRI